MISVVIATYNGQTVLPKTLKALSLITVPSQGVEFIFIDNASTDNSAKLLAEYINKLPLTILQEAKQGKSFAIHKGIEQAQGDLIVFSDDDVIPDKEWLVSYEKAAAKKESVSVFLGQIRPCWLAKPPNWLTQLSDDGKVCGCTSLALKSGAASANWAKGANFCIRKEVLESVSFRNDLWVAGKDCLGGEDTDFVKKAEEKGFKLWFVSEACLQHIIKPNEMTVKGIWYRYFRIGRSIENLDNSSANEKVMFIGYPRWFIVQQSKQLMKLLLNVVMFKHYQAMIKVIEIAVSYGQAYQNKHFNDK